MVLGCDGQTQGPSNTNVILISLDTLRRDFVGLYRSDAGVVTPNIDGLANSSVVFDNALAPVPFTLPSHMTLFTGLEPDVHGVETEDFKLSRTIPTLTEILSVNGFHAVGITTNLLMSPGFGFERGFESYERLEFDLVYSDRVRNRAFDLIDRRPPGDNRPFFLFLHFNDAHSDYHHVAKNPLPYYVPDELVREAFPDLDVLQFCDSEDNCATDMLVAANETHREIANEYLGRIRRLYGLGVEYLDEELGLLFDGLKERGLWENSIIIVTSDHGEEFREHGEFLHRQPYIETMAIPLIIKLPNGKHGGARRDGIVNMSDLAPTILDLLGISIATPMQGISLVPLIEGANDTRPTSLGKEKTSRRRYSLRTDTHTLIHDFETGGSELYDRRTDKLELIDLSEAQPEQVGHLIQVLEDLVSQNRKARLADLGDPVPQAEVLSEEDEERLRSLGYVD